ncbi:MAG: acyl-[acyl-carrier-protein]--UDP-N-acetylglucosamine O-acyltransferase, partial [Acidobacteriaceae bacterium]
GFDRDRIRAIHHAFRLLLSSKMNIAQALEALRAEGVDTEDVLYLVDFVSKSERGIIR